MRKLMSKVALGLICVLMMACSGNTVRLNYPPTEAGQLPAPNAKRVVVVMFEDKRANQNIGVRSNGTLFTGSASVADWVSRSLGDELLRAGAQISYATTLSEARSAKPNYIVTGIVSEVWLNEHGATAMNANIRLSISLSDSKSVLYSETLSSVQESKSVFSTSKVETLLYDSLREIIVPAARKIMEYVR